MDVTASRAALDSQRATVVAPGSFEPRDHFYSRVLNAQIHPLVSFFLRMSNQRIVNRYCQLNPRVEPAFLEQVLASTPKHFRWAGADLFCTTTAAGNRRLVVVETNSCPSGNKSMPIPSEDDEQAGYRKLIETAFLPLIARRRTLPCRLAAPCHRAFEDARSDRRTRARESRVQVLHWRQGRICTRSSHPSLRTNEADVFLVGTDPAVFGLRKGRPENDMTARLYIRGLPSRYDEDDLLTLCEPYGEINDLEVLYEQNAGHGGCSAIVDFYDFDDARCAADELNGHELDGRPLSVSFVSSSSAAFGVD